MSLALDLAWEEEAAKIQAIYNAVESQSNLTYRYVSLNFTIFCAAEFDNQTFGGESFFKKSSLSHLKQVTMKSNSKWRENCPFHIAYSNFTGDKALFVHTSPTKMSIYLQQR